MLKEFINKEEYKCPICKNSEYIFPTFKYLYRHYYYTHKDINLTRNFLRDYKLKHHSGEYETRQFKINKLSDDYAKGFVIGMLYA